MGKDYYFKRDEESSYVAHSSGPWKDHKYVRKIGDGDTAIYVYPDGSHRDAQGTPITQSKIYRQGMEKRFAAASAAAAAVDDRPAKKQATMSDVRKQMRAAYAQGKSDGYKKTKDRQYNFKKEVQNAKKKAKSAASRIGVGAKKELNQAKQDYANAKSRHKSEYKRSHGYPTHPQHGTVSSSDVRKKADKDFAAAKKKYKSASNKYSKTLVGKGEKVYSKAKKDVQRTARKAESTAKKTYSTAKKTYSKAKKKVDSFLNGARKTRRKR